MTNLGLSFDGSQELILEGYADADWAGDPADRRSVTGYVFHLCKTTVSWKSKKQPTVAGSTTEGEYMAAYFAASEAIWLRGLLAELGCPQETPTVIWSDNQSCIAIAKNPTLKSRAKHIDIKYHFLRERVTSGEIILKYVATQHQVADILTKPLGRSSFEIFREQMG